MQVEVMMCNMRNSNEKTGILFGVNGPTKTFVGFIEFNTDGIKYLVNIPFGVDFENEQFQLSSWDEVETLVKEYCFELWLCRKDKLYLEQTDFLNGLKI